MLSNSIERAIIMAAGFGSRLNPATSNTPKPLVKVNGQRMIDSIVSALHDNEIYEIYVVVGYLKEQFYEWVKQYNGITIIENPLFDKCNNISSLYAARDHIENAIIIDGDQIISDSSIFDRNFNRSGYNCTWSEDETNEWLMTVENNVVIKCSRTGGSKGWQLFGISRWTKEDGKKLKRHLEVEFDKNKNHQIYWDDVALFCHLEDYKLGIYPMKDKSVIEIDSFEELCAIDSSYRNIK